MIDIEEMINTNNFKSLLVADKEEIRLSGGIRYIITVLSREGVNKNILNEILIKHTEENPEKFEEYSRLIK